MVRGKADNEMDYWIVTYNLKMLSSYFCTLGWDLYWVVKNSLVHEDTNFKLAYEVCKYVEFRFPAW